MITIVRVVGIGLVGAGLLAALAIGAHQGARALAQGDGWLAATAAGTCASCHGRR